MLGSRSASDQNQIGFSLPRALVLSASNVDTHSIITGIKGVQALKEEHAYLWLIENKYYRCGVMIDGKHLDSSQSVEEVKVAEYEAVVLVFDSHQPETFTAIKSWWDLNKEDELPIKLAVAASTGVEPPMPTAAQLHIQEAENWCMEELIELIIADEENNNDHDATGAAGLERLQEALEAHMWPGLQRKQQQGVDIPSNASVETHEDQKNRNDSSLQGEASSSDRATSGDAPAAGAAAALAGLLDAQDLKALDVPMDELEKVFLEAAEAKDRLRGMNDAERRDAAAGIVLRLMEAMGLDDLEDDDSSNDGLQPEH